MSSVNSVRIPGLATGMDTDQMVKEMITGEQTKVDKAEQKKQTTKWQQESYRNIIKNVKGLYDKYFSATSPDYILSSKVFSTTTVNSSNSSIISAKAGAGANLIDYKFKVDAVAKPPRRESNAIGKDETMEKYITGDSSKITINGKEITINKTDTIKTVVDNINKVFSGGEVKAVYSEMTGKFSLEGNKTGQSSSINVQGELLNNLGMLNNTSINVISTKLDESKTLKEQGITGNISINGKSITIKDTDKISDLVTNINDPGTGTGVTASLENGQLKITTASVDGMVLSGQAFEKMGINTNGGQPIKTQAIQGSNNSITVYSNDGKELKKISEESNSFTIDNITYNVNGVTTGTESVSMTSQKDTKPTVEKTKVFIEEYNKMIDGIYDSVTEKKNRDYPPLTEAQRKDMSEEEIENWEKKAKEGILRNDKELRAFMDDIKSALNSQIGDSKTTLRDIGITTDNDYNKSGQLCVDVDKFIKTLEEKPDLAYKVTVGGFEKLKDVTYKYAGSSAGLFVKKAGMEKSSTEINNLFSSQIKKQEEQIKNLTRKMKDKEGALYKKFADLESNMNKLNSQMSYLTSSMGM